MLGEVAYTLDIRPTFIDELDRAVAYIERKFRNPIAADNLIADVYAAIDGLDIREVCSRFLRIRHTSRAVLGDVVAGSWGGARVSGAGGEGLGDAVVRLERGGRFPGATGESAGRLRLFWRQLSKFWRQNIDFRRQNLV